MKYHIIGGAGSGKTVLAAKLSKKLNIKVYSLDEINWIKGGFASKTTMQYKQNKIDKICLEDSYITEGIYYDWVSKLYDDVDKIIVLKTSVYLQKFRTLRRFVKRKLKIEKSDRKENLSKILNLIKRNKEYNKNNMERVFKYIDEKNQSKIVLIKNKRQLKDFLKKE